MTLSELSGRTVGELAVEMPVSIRVFENWKIDYCCGGKTPLADACAAKGRTLDDFAAELGRTAAVPEMSARSWDVSLGAMAAEIVAMYHDYTRQELDTLMPLAAKVLSVHGERRPELSKVYELVLALNGDMVPHMLREEQVLFPYVTQLEQVDAGKAKAATPFFGTVRNPVRKMMLEHDQVGELLVALRTITEGYALPDGACFSYRELYRRLEEFEQRTHEHVHIENNIYFPRAIELEDRAGQPADFAHGCNH